MYIGRTPGIADPSLGQVLASPSVTTQQASLGVDESVDEDGFFSSLIGYFHLRGLGLGFFTNGEHPRLDHAERNPSAVETALRRAGGEAWNHSLFHLFGLVPVEIFRALRGNSPLKRAAKLGKRMLRNPASFTVPWPALVEAAYAAPFSLTRSVEPVLVDPLVLTFERDGGLQNRVVFLQRGEAVDDPTPPPRDLFRQRARFEQLAATLGCLAAAVDNGRGPFDSFQLYKLSRGWFGNDGDDAFATLVGTLSADLPAADLTARANAWLARFPIAAALDGGGRLSDGIADLDLPAEGWPFPARFDPSEVVPWLDLL